ncbi:MAG: WD40 repeat domain-containing protein, partial [Spirochaetales bacterium]|nr:WD40 repeat domain-containing protein [Spirochaetales bacterium]
MRPTRLSTCILICVLVSSSLAALPLITVRSSHSSQIHDMVYETEEDLLFTAGEDGKLLVWDTSEERLVQSIRIDQIPLQKIALYPDSERIAVYSSDGQRHRITVWRWREGTRSFLYTPEDAVLWMVPSPQGSYIMYSIPSLRSVRVIDGDNGRALPFLRQNTGIVSWMVVADSEERVMTYAPATGEIAYRTVTNGRIAGSFEGPRNLSLLTLLSTRRFAAARSGTGRLVVIDLLSGNQVAQADVGDIESIQTDAGNGDIIAVIQGDRNRTVRRYRFTGDAVQQRYATRRELSPSVVSQTFADDTLFAGTRNGEILSWPPFASRPLSFAENQINPVSDLYAVENRLHMLTPDRVVSIASDFFDAQTRDGEDTSYVSFGETSVAAGGRSRFIVAEDDLLLWTPESRDGRIKSYQIDTSELTPLDWTLESGLLSIHAYQDEILSLTRGGTVELRQQTSGDLLFSYRGRGLQTAIRTSRGIFVGNARQDALDSAILRLNPHTQETVPLETESRLVFFLAFDERRGRLFAIGVRDNRSGVPSTVIEVFEGVNLNRRRTI